jgi:hypothetical protein
LKRKLITELALLKQRDIMDTIIASISDIVKIRLYDFFKSDNVQYTTASVMLSITLMNLLISNMKTFTLKNLIFKYHYYYYKVFQPKYEGKIKYDFSQFTMSHFNENELYKKVLIEDKKYDFAILQFMTDNLVILHDTSTLLLNKNTEKVFISSDVDSNKLYTHKFYDSIPIFYYKGHIIYYTNKSSNVLHYINSEALFAFIKYLQPYCEKYNNNEDIIIDKPSTIYQYIGDGQKENCGDIDINKTFDNYVLNNKTRLITIINKFKDNLKSNDIYKAKNLGILIQGTEGTGKTSFIKCVANFLKRNVILINLRNIKTTKEFTQILNTGTEDYIFVLDELDYCLESNKLDTHKDDIKILLRDISECKSDDLRKQLQIQYQELKTNLDDTFNLYSMLIVLDGMIEFNGRVIIATTNNIEKIPGPLKRPGRFDHILEFKKFIHSEIKELLEKMYKQTIDFHIKFPDYKFSPAEISCMYQSGLKLDEIIAVLTKD